MGHCAEIQGESVTNLPGDAPTGRLYAGGRRVCERLSGDGCPFETRLRGVSTRPLVACIGPITAKTAEELGLRVDVVATEYTVEGLVRAIKERLNGAT